MSAAAIRTKCVYEDGGCHTLSDCSSSNKLPTVERSGVSSYAGHEGALRNQDQRNNSEERYAEQVCSLMPLAIETSFCQPWLLSLLGFGGK